MNNLLFLRSFTFIKSAAIAFFLLFYKNLFKIHRGMALGLVIMTGRIGSVVGSNLFGAFLLYHCELGYIIVGIVLVIAAVLVYIILGRIDKAKYK